MNLSIVQVPSTSMPASVSPVPDRQYTSVGQVAYDQCPQATVTLTGIALVNPFPARDSRRPRGAVVPAADLLVEVTRCAPPIVNGKFPEIAALEAAGDQVMADMEALVCALTNAMLTIGPTGQPGILVPGYALSSLGQVTPYGPSGGVMGCKLPVTITFDCV